MLSRIMLPPSGKKIAVCFAIAAAGGAFLAGTKMYFDDVRTSITEAEIVQNPNYAQFMDQCLHKNYQQQLDVKMGAIKERLEKNQIPTPEELAPPQASQDLCVPIAQEQSRRDIGDQKIFLPWSAIPVEIGMLAVGLGTLGGLGGSIALGGEALARRRENKNKPGNDGPR